MRVARLFRRYQRNTSGWAEWSFVAITLAGFAAVVFSTIGKASVWFDESFSAYIIRFSYADIAKFTSLDVHPPLYYWTLKTWSLLFGTNEVALRAMSMCFAIVALLFAYLILRRLFTRGIALTALPFVAFSPMIIRYAQEMRMYTMVLAICLAATYTLMRAQTSSSKKTWTVYGVLVAIGMWTHYFALLIWLGHWANRVIETHHRHISLRQWTRAFFTKQWVMSYALAIVLFIPWMPWLIRQTVQVQSNGFWIPNISPATIPSYLTDTFLYLTADLTSPWLTMLVGCICVCGAMVLYRTYRSVNRTERRALRSLLVGATVPVCLLMIVSLPPLGSAFVDRYVLTAIAMLIMVLAVSAVSQMKRRKLIGYIMSGLLAGASVIGIVNVDHYGTYNMLNHQSTEAKQLIMIARNSYARNQPIIASNPWLYYCAAAYSKPDHPVYFMDQYTTYRYGSLAMLKQSNIGKIKDIQAFIDEHPTFWYIGDASNTTNLVFPLTNVRVLKRVSVVDPILHRIAGQAVQYQVTGV